MFQNYKYFDHWQNKGEILYCTFCLDMGSIPEISHCEHFKNFYIGRSLRTELFLDSSNIDRDPVPDLLRLRKVTWWPCLDGSDVHFRILHRRNDDTATITVETQVGGFGCLSEIIALIKGEMDLKITKGEANNRLDWEVKGSEKRTQSPVWSSVFCFPPGALGWISHRMSCPQNWNNHIAVVRTKELEKRHHGECFIQKSLIHLPNHWFGWELGKYCNVWKYVKCFLYLYIWVCFCVHVCVSTAADGCTRLCVEVRGWHLVFCSQLSVLVVETGSPTESSSHRLVRLALGMYLPQLS